MDNRIKIIVKPQYVPEQSDPVRSYYVFAYHITITNQGEHTSQLLSRYWQITDGQGNVEDIHGPFGSHHGDFCRWPSIVKVGTEVLA